MEKFQDPAGIQTQDLLNTSQTLLATIKPCTWTPGRGAEDKLHKQHSLEASGEFSLSQGWIELKLWLNFTTFKGSVMTHSPPSSCSSHNQGWW